MNKTKIIFVATSFQSNSLFTGTSILVDGVQTSTNIQAAIDRMEKDGYEFINSENYISAKHRVSYTEGTFLYFRKIESSNE